MIDVQNVSKTYANGNLALDNINLKIAQGEFAFVTGQTGAGKSTLLKLISGIETSTQGQIRVAKFNLNRIRQKHVALLRRRMGIVLQNPPLLEDRSVFENVALPLTLSGHSMVDTRIKVQTILKKVQLLEKMTSLCGELSMGEQQKVAIARAIVDKPEILLADEPTSHMDHGAATEMMHLFEQLNQMGMTIILASHDGVLMHHFKHRVITLKEGKLQYFAKVS